MGEIKFVMHILSQFHLTKLNNQMRLCAFPIPHPKASQEQGNK